MAEIDLSLEKLLQMLADDRDKYRMPVVVSARYTMKFIVDHEDISVLEVIPPEVRDKILELARRHESGEKVQLISSLGTEDFSEEIQSFVSVWKMHRKED